MSAPSAFPGQFQRALHLFALVQVAVAYPLYDLLSRYPEFFVARQSQPLDILLLTAAVSLAFPAVLFGLQALAAGISERLGRWFHLLLVALLFLLLGLSLSAKLLDGPAALASGIAFCLVLTLAYARTRVAPLFVSFLAPAIVVVPAFFLLNPEVRPLLHPVEPAATAVDSSARPNIPIVFVVFDELPTFVLLDRQGDIDAERFPNFARLARTAHWYPNATTVATATTQAIPPILTGRYPAAFVMPHHGEFPDNLFTWLGGAYDLNVEEAVSVLCHERLCGTGRLPPAGKRLHSLLLDGTAIFINIVASDFLPGRLPIVTQSWADFWGTAEPGGQMYEHRLQQLDDFAQRIRATEKPGLDFIHINFPHIPYEYLPSGKRYGEGWLIPGLDFATDTWVGAAWQTEQSYQRFVLQLQALDLWLGRLLDRLEALALFDRSLIVLTADHGVSFAPGANRRDSPPLENLDRNILPVPLLIKAPHQTEGVVDRRNAETVDIMPTLAELLHRPLTWAVDGVSLLGDPKPPAKRAVHHHKAFDIYRTDSERVESALSASARTIDDRGDPELAKLERMLAGHGAREFILRDEGAARCEVQDLEYFQNVDLGGTFLPAHVNGVVDAPKAESILLAIALNGVIVAVTRSYPDLGEWRFSAMLPEAAFHSGENSLQVFILESGAADRPVLTAIGPENLTKPDQWLLEGDVLNRNGNRLTTDDEGIEGQIDYVSRSDDSVELFGWAIDAAQRRTVQSVLVFDDGRLVYQGETRMLREETHRFGVIVNVGFHAVVPARGAFGAIGTRPRVFAVTADGRARELHLKAASGQ